MATLIHGISLPTVEDIVRNIDFPAMETGPLYRIMFPPVAELTEGQREEIICWYSEGLRDALTCPANSFLQICTPDGIPVGFCGWMLGPLGPRESNPNANSNQSTLNTLPQTLNIAAWGRVSCDLRRERERALKGLNAFCRKSGLQYMDLFTYIAFLGLTFMSVRPDFQRQGFGSQLLMAACHEIDKLGLPAFVIASPAGVPLYSKFGFNKIREIKTSAGTMVSMLRPAASI